MTVSLHLGDCRDVMKTLPANSIHAIITDPPYGLSNHKPEDVIDCLRAWLNGDPYAPDKRGFMGKGWDAWVPGPEVWRECLRVLKPGGHLLCFAGTRSMDLMSMAIRLAGFELRDSIGYAHDTGGAPLLAWTFGSGFPKSLAIDKAIDKHFGAEREVIGRNQFADRRPNPMNGTAYQMNATKWDISANLDITAPATPAAQQWAGWGTSLKPAYEPVILASKPLPDQTERDIIVGNLFQKETQLWLLLHASTVGRSSMSSQAELNEALDIAQWSAEKLTSIQADLCGQMDTSQFVSVLSMCLNTVTSWKSTLADLWNPGNTCTTLTVSSPTIDLKTLSCLLSQTTLKHIVQAELTAPGSRLNVLPVGAYLNAVEANISSTRMLSALENATYEGHIKHLEGTAELSPAWEPIVLAMKPLDGTFANNALVHGVAGLNIDACRIPTGDDLSGGTYGGVFSASRNPDGTLCKAIGSGDKGRWPANLILDEESVALLDQMSGISGGGQIQRQVRKRKGFMLSGSENNIQAANAPDNYGDSGGASRFFYCAKASKRDRDEGLEGMPERTAHSHMNTHNGTSERFDGAATPIRRNTHNTVKPTSLMRYLVRLVTPPGGTVLDPFCGSGSTGKAAKLEGFSFVGIELDAEYLEIARRRIEAVEPETKAQLPLWEAAG